MNASEICPNFLVSAYLTLKKLGPLSTMISGADKSHRPTPRATSFSGRTAKIISSTCPWASEMSIQYSPTSTIL